MTQHDELESRARDEDALLEAKVRAAYDNVQLDDRVRGSMLQALVQAAEQAEREAPDEPLADGSQEGGGTAVRGARRRRTRALRFALPAAACLVIAVVAGTVTMTVVSPSSSQHDTMAAESTTVNDTEGASDGGGTSTDAAEDAAHSAPSSDEVPAVSDADLAAEYPMIVLPDGVVLEVTSTEAPSAPDSELQEAVATTRDGTHSVPCWYCQLPNTRYAVTYNHATFIYARPA